MIYIASDHRGFEMKKYVEDYLTALKKEFKDLGPETYVVDDDYPDYVKKVCDEIKDQDIGILICDTGIGMSIAANRYHHIRAALCSSIFDAFKTREDNNANVLVLGVETNDSDNIKAIIKTFLDTNFSYDERHIRRINKL